MSKEKLEIVWGKSISINQKKNKKGRDMRSDGKGQRMIKTQW